MTLSPEMREQCFPFIGKRIFFLDEDGDIYLNRGIAILPALFPIGALVCIVEPGGLPYAVCLSDIFRTEDVPIVELLTHENENVRKFGLENLD